MTIKKKTIPFLLEPKAEIGAAEFKARCLEILDAVERSGIEVTITKHRKPVARVVPADGARKPFLSGLQGKSKILGDVNSTGDEWSAHEGHVV